MIALRLPVALVLLLVAACSTAEESQPGGTDVEAGDSALDTADDATVPPPRCEPGPAWQPGRPMFREVTREWGLEGVVGTTLSVGDIDGDGYPDLFVRGASAQANSYGEDGRRVNWLLRNTGSGFEDVTESSGIEDRRSPLAERGRPMGVVAFADVDNDGDLDVYTGADTFDLSSSGGESSEVMLNSGQGFFSFTREDSAVRRVGLEDSPASAAFVDVDRDGWVDLWVPQQEYTPPGGQSVIPQDRLYRGLGHGLFEDVTMAWGLETQPWLDVEAINQGRAHSRAWAALACDLNNDGLPELLVASYGRSPNHLWRGEPTSAGEETPRYTNQSVASGFAYDDNQSWKDNEFAKCFCESNPSAEDCEGVEEPRINCPSPPNWRHDTDREPFRLGGNSGTVLCADLNNDGQMDLVTTEIRHWWAGSGSDESTVLWNTGDPEVRLERRSRSETGLVVPHATAPSWDEGHISAAVLDVDNDGWPDLYIGGSEYPGNAGLLFRQVAPGQFELVSPADGIDHNRSQGVVVADFDRDGDLDILVGHSRMRCDANAPNDCYPTQQVRLFENIVGQDRSWVQLRLEGVWGTNLSAIGARVQVSAAGVTQTQEVGGGHGRSGAQNDLVLHFGLGDACEAEVEIRWPDAPLSTQQFRVAAGALYHVVQGLEPVLVELNP